jgi:hypothetical protein
MIQELLYVQRNVIKSSIVALDRSESTRERRPKHLHDIENPIKSVFDQIKNILYNAEHTREMVDISRIRQIVPG